MYLSKVSTAVARDLLHHSCRFLRGIFWHPFENGTSRAVLPKNLKNLTHLVIGHLITPLCLRGCPVVWKIWQICCNMYLWRTLCWISIVLSSNWYVQFLKPPAADLLIDLSCNATVSQCQSHGTVLYRVWSVHHRRTIWWWRKQFRDWTRSR